MPSLVQALLAGEGSTSLLCALYVINDVEPCPSLYRLKQSRSLDNDNDNDPASVDQDNLSPLHVAAGMGHIDVTKRLLDNGADMEAEDNALYTPLWRAAYYGHPEVVQVRPHRRVCARACPGVCGVDCLLLSSTALDGSHADVTPCLVVVTTCRATTSWSTTAFV